jgi:hypothetical protein
VFGFIGDVVENIGDVILPKGTRGATLGGFVGRKLGSTELGATIGAGISSAIASGSRGQEAISSPTANQAPALAPESAVSSLGPSVYRPTFTDYEGRVPIEASIGTAARTVRDVAVGMGAGEVIDQVADIMITGFGSDPCAAKMKKLVGMRRDPMTGAMCPTVTRKQQATLRKMLEYLPIEEVAYQAGVDVSTLARLVAKSMPARKRGISGAQLSTAKRVNNQILNMAGKLGYNVTPKTKAQLNCK